MGPRNAPGDRLTWSHGDTGLDLEQDDLDKSSHSLSGNTRRRTCVAERSQHLPGVRIRYLEARMHAGG